MKSDRAVKRPEHGPLGVRYNLVPTAEEYAKMKPLERMFWMARVAWGEAITDPRVIHSSEETGAMSSPR